MMSYFPVFLDLRGKECLVVGAGGVGKRKICSLSRAHPKKILVLDPEVEDNFLKDIDCVVVEKRKFTPADLEGKFLVIVATDDEALNKEISDLCRKQNILCNVVDKPDLCSFIVPAILEKGNIKIAISTGGKSPAMARYIKEKVISNITEEIVILTELLGRIRPYVISLGKSSEENKNIFLSLIEPKMLEAIKFKDRKFIISRLKQILPYDEQKIKKIVNGIWEE
jgi:precorrin-2 dehydrogenase/sirohydrochlorin ferrochelatase